jgi:hypothetical protein
MSKPILNPDPRLQPPNFGVGETYSWVQVGGVAERQMYARATYVTNLADLVLNLSATDVRIGGVEIVDNDSGLRCDVTSFEYEDGSFNALRVTTQDLEPIYDGVAIGDQNGNMVTVNESTSSLNVNITNFLELSSVIPTERITSLLEALTAREYDININAQDINVNTDEVESQLRTAITLLNSLTSVDYSTTFKQNQLITLLTVLTAKETSISFDVSAINVNTDEVESLIKKSNTLLSTLTSVNYATATNQNTELTLLRTLTSVNYATATNQNTELTLLRTLTSNSVYGTLQIQPIFVTGSLSATVLNTVSAFSITNQLTGITVLNPITAVNVLNDISVYASATLPVSGAVTVLNAITAVSLIDQLSSFTILNPVTAVSLINQLTSVSVINDVSVYASTTLPISGAVTIIDPVSAFSITNQLTGITVLNPITAVEITNTITVTGAVTIIDPLSAISIVNQLSAFTITNPVTAVDILNTVTVNGNVTTVNPVTAVNINNSIALKDVNNNDVTVVASTSSLNVNITNSVTATVDPVIGFPVTFASSNNFDAFGRLRVSTPLTVFDSSHRYKDNNLWSSLTAVNGTWEFNNNQGLVDLTVNSSSGSSVIRETTKVFSYQPGKSLLIFTTFVMAPSTTNLRQRVGYFGDSNGIYLQLDDEVISFVERTQVYGTPSIETIVPLSAWNGDRLNGTGTSGLTLDITKAQIFWMDVEWLGVGTVRTGFVINGKFITCHSFHHANILGTTYITTASLPLRQEITNKDDTVSSNTMKQICSTVISEGGYELRGLQQAIGTSITSPRVLTSAGTYYPVISIRLRNGRLDAIVIITALSLMGIGNGINYNWQLHATGSTNGGAWVSADIDGAVEYNITGTSFTSGRILASGFLNSSNQGSPTTNLLKEALFKFQLERNGLTNTPYEISLVAAAGTNSESIFASMDWEEVSR